jgi:hypothetical protein
MAHQTPIENPFMLMLQPEVVLAAIENSERLSRLDRHVCRPLDKPSFGTAKEASEVIDADDGIDADADELSQAADRQ